MPSIQFDRFAVQRTAQVGVRGTLQLPTIFLKAVEVRMNMVCGIDDKCSVLADDELVQPNNRQRAAKLLSTLYGTSESPKWWITRESSSTPDVRLRFRIRYANNRNP